MLLAFGALAAQGESLTPQELVANTSREVLHILNEQGSELKGNPEKLNELIYNVILPVIDFNAFAKLTLGRHWRTARSEQRRRFAAEFQGMLIRSYAKYLVDYADVEISVLPPRGRQDGRRQTVFTEVKQSGKPTLPINYSFWLKKGKWRVYNVTVNGLNLVQLFRTSFAEEIDQTSLDALIDRLATTNRVKNDHHEPSDLSKR